LSLLNLSEHQDAHAARVDKTFQVPNLLRRAHERHRNKIDLLLNAEKDVCIILFRYGKRRERDFRYVDSLILLERPAIDNLAMQPYSLSLEYLKAHQPIVEKHRATRAYVLHKVFIAG